MLRFGMFVTDMKYRKSVCK